MGLNFELRSDLLKQFKIIIRGFANCKTWINIYCYFYQYSALSSNQL